MKLTSTYSYPFKNGTITITRGITTKFDWDLKIKLTDSDEGEKRYICLDRTVFLTKRHAKEYAIKQLSRFKLI